MMKWQFWKKQPAPTVADMMAAYAQDAVAHARRRGIELDFSEASLAEVDRVLQQTTGGGVTPQTTDDEEALWLVAKMYGGYVGQVVIGAMGGQWELKDQPGGANVILRSHGVVMTPLERVYKRLTLGDDGNVAGYSRALRAIIEQRPPPVTQPSPTDPGR